MKVILLDLNYTLVANSEQRKSPFAKQIAAEEYRIDLIEHVKDNLVILMTARPIKYCYPTLKNIIVKTGWTPNDYYFNYHFLPPHIFKEKVLMEHLLEKYQVKDMFAIESNSYTRKMYAKYEIASMTYEEFRNNNYQMTNEGSGKNG